MQKKIGVVQEREYKYYFLGLVDCCLHLQLNIRGFNFSMEQEIWKTIDGFNGYDVSNLGRVRSKERIITIHRKSRTYTRRQNEAILTPSVDKDGYFYVTLYDNKSHKGVHFRISRLVAKAFIPNPDNLPQVNHKDLNRKNNSFRNLEWCDNVYNVNYMDAPKRSGMTRRNNVAQSKQICQLLKNGVFVKEYPSLSEASRITGINVSHICQTCLGNYKSAGWFLWKYKE